jgi:ketosteroid isomerase-like protein
MSLAQEVTRRFDALNHGNADAFLDLYDPDIELFVPAWAGPDSGVVRGADAVNRWNASYFARWPGREWELVETFEKGPNVAFVLRGGEVRLFGVMSFQEGRIVSIAHLGGLGEMSAG